jgi:hypothetical protein
MKLAFQILLLTFAAIMLGCTSHTIAIRPDKTVGDPDLEFIVLGQAPAFGPTTTQWDLIARFGQPTFPSSDNSSLIYTFARYNYREAKGTLSKIKFTIAPDQKVTACDTTSETIRQPPSEPKRELIAMPETFKFPLPPTQSTAYLQNGRFRIKYKASKWTRFSTPDLLNGVEPLNAKLIYNEHDAISAEITTQTPAFGSFNASTLINSTINTNPYTQIPINESRLIKNLLVREIHFIKKSPPSGILRIIYIIYKGKEGHAELSVAVEEASYESYKHDIEELVNSFEFIPDQRNKPQTLDTDTLLSSL